MAETPRANCDLACEIPATVTEVPRPRHAWGDVLICPNDGCERAFLVLDAPKEPTDDRR